MSDDIGELLREWPYDERQDVMVRRVSGPEGDERLQIRVELGIVELHTTGRPDGARPSRHESLLHYHLARIEHDEDDGEPSFQLTHEECVELHREAMQYYHRRISYLKLGDYDAAAADAEHNLAIMDLLRERAASRADWLQSEQYRAFVLSHWARARALGELERGDVAGALAAVDEGVDRIKALFRDSYGRPDLVDNSEELNGLRELYDTIRERYPRTPEHRDGDVERLERELTTAIEREDFERAAELRDALDRLRGGAGFDA